ncbi:carbohydrate ABC transporter permease [Allorhizobium taibaishanense]|uniref:Multiple sugar transport system permease protein n=1 Tax=Allorhizobium taibaishanense TaxID=887144 RepID=A0A1Q9A6N2_9HYPH|nr:carbohydrate ABC transporter permease [Allorhizobium taibaishanense]MBB4008616.1 multiple sugar transport system permease protein [Allorhizobium taibaishanense]OLP50246.1 sugar ABC transporter permease [Allorhizobium taibaishanense]
MTDAAHAAAPDAIAEEKRRWWISLLLHVVLAVASLIMLYPLLWMLSGSIKDQSEIFGQASLIPHKLDFSAYMRGWFSTQVSFGTYFWNSLVIAVLTVVGNLFSCSLAAYAFARLEFKGRNLWFALMLGTLMLPYHVTLIPQYILFLKLGWVKTILPLVVPKFLAVDAFFIFLMVQFFRGIPRELDEAAMMDGCSPWRIYWRIMLPLSLPVLATAAIFSFIWSWDDFFGPLIYLSDINTYTVQLGLRSFVDSSGSSDWSGLFAMSSLSLVPIFLIFLFCQRLLIDGIATAGLKR